MCVVTLCVCLCFMKSISNYLSCIFIDTQKISTYTGLCENHYCITSVYICVVIIPVLELTLSTSIGLSQSGLFLFALLAI